MSVECHRSRRTRRRQPDDLDVLGPRSRDCGKNQANACARNRMARILINLVHDDLHGASGLTTKAQRPGAREAWIATATLTPGSPDDETARSTNRSSLPGPARSAQELP